MMDCPSNEGKRREVLYSPENPKTDPDILFYWRLAVNLGLMELVLSNSQCIPDNEETEND